MTTNIPDQFDGKELKQERPRGENRRFRDGDEWASVSVDDAWSPARTCVGAKPKADASDNHGGGFLARAFAPLVLVGLLLLSLGVIVLVLLTAIFVSPVYVVLKRIDGRSKVTVHRTESSGRWRRWRVLKVEYYRTEEEAEVRQQEILKNWSTGHWALGFGATSQSRGTSAAPEVVTMKVTLSV